MARRTNDVTTSLVSYCVNLPDLNGTTTTTTTTTPNSNGELNGEQSTGAAVSPVLGSVGTICVEFKQKNVGTFEDMFQSLVITEKDAHATYLGVVNELFAKGITWARIMALLTFSSLFATQCADKKVHSTDTVIDWTVKYVEDHLSSWIEDHGGWDAFADSMNTETRNGCSSFKRLFWGAAGALGAVTLGAFLASRS